MSGWPEHKEDVPNAAAPYFKVRDELAVQNGVIFHGKRAVVLKSLIKEMLKRIHSSYIGVEGCLRRARDCLYWPGISSDVKHYVQKCEVCWSTDVKQQKEHLQAHEAPTPPWTKVAIDLFHCNGNNYLVMVDYNSGFWEVDLLDSTVTSQVIREMKMQLTSYMWHT